MRLVLASDHAGFLVKQRLVELLRGEGHEVLDLGTRDETPCDYPDYGFALGEAVMAGKGRLGIIVCGSSIGVAIAANKVRGVCAAPVTEPYAAELSRRHNDANVLALSERLTGWDMIERIVRVFLDTPFDGGRHTRRVEKLTNYDERERRKALADVERGTVEGAQTPVELLR
ncbi:MAG: ribose 5-phosphate isomerase B [bacterium]|nr:ribose 5-phosphate isomerase B [bacterium]